MKTRFNTYDIVCAVTELQKLVGLRVNQIYDIDNKTYLIRLGGGDTKSMLLIESGIRFHTTAFEWPKNLAPSGFSMKLRKHLKNKRLEKLQQLGGDRIVDLQFGAGDAAYHIILELYDRGNVILTDHTFMILYILRPHFEGDEVRFAMREKYPVNRAKEQSPSPSEDTVRALLQCANNGDNLRRLLMPILDCGPAVIDHVLTQHKLECVEMVLGKDSVELPTESSDEKKLRKLKKKKSSNVNMRPFQLEQDLPALMLAIQDAINMLNEAHIIPSKGYIIQKQEDTPVKEDAKDSEPNNKFYQNIEYHPYLFSQFEGQPVANFETFLLAVDEFYSTLEGQKIDMRTLQQEREALKKLSNVKKDHLKRLEDLTKVQEGDKQKAELISCNQAIVDNAILAIRSAVANQMSWPDIHELVKAAQANGDPVANTIKQLKLEVNHISLSLSDPYHSSGSDEDRDSKPLSTQVVDVDLSLSAWANARKYYDLKRTAAQKEQKTLDASQKALKSAERKTQQTLKDVHTISTISKARKVYWFEKFYWFISSENYLVIGGRDAQQNELIVKRYMRPPDIYVHAEIQGASSVVIRNPSGGQVPPKTLLEAGTMAISYSVAWDAKVVTNAYWVHSDQVSKTAPTGEYLSTGSFMVRGKKNFLPSCHLILGLSLLFKLEDSFVEKHRGERKVRTFEEEPDEELIERRLQNVAIENEKLDVIVEYKEEELTDNKAKQPTTEGTSDEETISQEGENHSDAFIEGQKHEKSNFPDTQVKIEHVTIRPVVGTELFVSNSNQIIVATEKSSATDEATIIPAAPTRKKQQQNAKKRKEEKDRKIELRHQQQNAATDPQSPSSSSQMKRGQKGKLKKIKSKYKYQDEEERELRMQILKSSGKDKIANDDQKQNEETETLLGRSKTKCFSEKKLQQEKQHQEQSQLDIDDNTDDIPIGADLEMLDSLTGQPFDNDELLFAIPVVAPYQALHNYKFKVKLTPGTGKRGRAAKTALTMFSKDKSCGLREKDLLKGIKEETLARNIPGKVKLSAPQLQKFKK